MDRLGDMQAFVRVVEAGSISRAGDQLGIAKSAVSRRLQDLERRLGAQLFLRQGRRLQVSDTGAAFYRRCQQILADVSEAEQEASDAQAELSGPLRVAAPVSFGTRHLPPALFAFAAAHPAVRLDLVLSDRRIDLVSENVDLALRIGRLSEADLIARRLARIRHVACASPAYLAARGTPATPAELAEHDGLCYGGVAKPATWSCKHPDGRIERLQPRERLRADNGDVLRQAALDGLGIIVEPTFIVHADLEAGRLVPILTAVSWSKVHLHAVYAPTRHLSRKVRALIDSLADRFAGTPPWDRDMPLPAHDP